MPKALCLTSLVASILIVVLFLLDAAAGMLGMTDLAPMLSANMTMDIVFIVMAGTMSYLSWSTYREQR